jgi:serralysin
MAKQGRSAVPVALAAGVALSVLSVGLALSGARDTAGLRAAAKVPPKSTLVALGLNGSTRPLGAAYCFDPLRPPSPELLQLLTALYEQGTDFNLGSGAWPGGGNGSPPSTITWSFVADGTQVPNLNNVYGASTLFSSMDSKFGGNRQLWISKFQQIFDRWAALTGTSYQRVTNNGTDWDDGASFPGSGASSTPGATRGAVRISMRTLDVSGGVLAFNYYPSSGGDMVIDSLDNWQSSSGDYRFLRNTVAHEHGHGLGIAHVCPMNSSKLMEPALATAFDGPQQDDIRAGHRLYGDAYEPNNSSAQAWNLGTVPFATTVTPSTITGTAVNNATLTSIYPLSDSDWYKFTVTEAALVNVVLSPRGSTYLDGVQNNDGSCTAGTNVNTLITGDLAATVYGTDGFTVLGTANTQPAGMTENINGLLLPGAGTYFVRVSASSLSNVQLYDVRVTANPAIVCPNFTDQPQSQEVCEGGAVFLYANATGSPAPSFQWRRNGNNIPGQTSNSLILNPVNAGNVGSYTCVATNSCGSDESDPALVTVAAIQGFTTQPQSQTVAPGSPVSFSVAVNATGTLQYQWFKDNQPLSGAAASTYQIQSATPGDQGSYRCVVSTDCDSLPSDAATLTVSTGGGCYANCDNSTATPVLNVGDFTCFLQRFAAGESYANCDSSTSPPVLNVGDFTCFLQRFAAGCP